MQQQHHCHSITAFQAVYKKLEQIKGENIALFSSYPEQLNEKMRRKLNEVNITISYQRGMGIIDDRVTGKLTPEAICQFVLSYRNELYNCDAIFLSCTNMRAYECKQKLERALSLPVVTSNDAIVSEIRRFL